MVNINNSKQILKLFVRNMFGLYFLMVLVFAAFNLQHDNVWYPYNWSDEVLYKNDANNFTIDHIKDLYNNAGEAKPLTFITLEKILGNANQVYTRIFNIILIGITTLLIYKITNNKLSFLYIMLPIFLNSMFLTAEIIEIVFILLSMIYVKRSGIFVGLAMIFRPYAIAYTLLLKKRQIPYVILIGLIFSVVLVVLGLFIPYLHMVTGYGSNRISLAAISPAESIAVYMMLISLAVCGYRRELLKYAVVSAIPLYIVVTPHYFLPIFTFLYIGFLLNMNEDLQKLKFNPKFI